MSLIGIISPNENHLICRLAVIMGALNDELISNEEHIFMVGYTEKVSNKLSKELYDKYRIYEIIHPSKLIKICPIIVNTDEFFKKDDVICVFA